ncbi:MAG TPA: hypothetical protein PKE16_13935 [Hyphomicrobium sp.]|nr:hypothetical protein [Hyphomicrobium sp.]
MSVKPCAAADAWWSADGAPHDELQCDMPWQQHEPVQSEIGASRFEASITVSPADVVRGVWCPKDLAAKLEDERCPS